MNKIIESYQDFLGEIKAQSNSSQEGVMSRQTIEPEVPEAFVNEAFMKAKFFGINFSITSKIDIGQRKANYNFIPSTMKDIESIEDKSNLAKIIESFLVHKTGLNFEYNQYDTGAGLTFSILITELEDVMMKVLK
jgi:hypothetical protein